jgi:alanine racemase
MATIGGDGGLGKARLGAVRATRAQVLAARPTWLEVDKDALTHNLRQVRRRLLPTTRLMAVVKANAYGHGAVEVAKIVLAAGADQLAVATLGEALELRQAGVVAPTLVLGYTPVHLYGDALRQEVTLTLFDADEAGALDAEAARQGSLGRLHVKVNTGMNRLGVAPGAAPALLAALARLPHLQVEGIFSHFATSDGDLTFAEAQFAPFAALLQTLTAQGLRPPLAHMANSAAILRLPHTQLEMVRCGIALYGLDPDVDEAPLPDDFLPVLCWKAQVAQVRNLQPGDSVSYGREFVATQPMTTATLPVGYADGFPRRPLHWGHVLIHGQPAPLLGRVCMDQCVVDVSAIGARTPVQVGDEAVLIGRQGEAEISAAEAARRIGTINYDVVSRILARVPRVIVAHDTGA